MPWFSCIWKKLWNCYNYSKVHSTPMDLLLDLLIHVFASESLVSTFFIIYLYRVWGSGSHWNNFLNSVLTSSGPLLFKGKKVSPLTKEQRFFSISHHFLLLNVYCHFDWTGNQYCFSFSPWSYLRQLSKSLLITFFF